MPRVERSVLVHYSAEQMFDLVADVEAYPRFLPWCSGASIVPDREGGLDASVDIDYRGIRSRFTTRNQMRYPEQIRMSLLEGPFRTLDGLWHFHALRPGACKVQLALHYEFASGLLERAVRPAFDAIANSMVDSFAQRAEAVYGPME
ncbi:MAG TPA: type II toxin-antitoxin system RatA family toxin [Burkholderiaceae bacterium]|nr:type II toxin-antitoxin system RatA family toxin [Burkholderiaceae bacterium]